ncbi:ABC-2 type transport system ATP-binding protein [Metabacillus crassostreae]|uniref:ABC transporter ATP-binding protein n=1 Tax=Metabacillus crassostreae TaxID=929098 RepID=UPI00195D2A4D|nr:ABC transporter ATP-binding protein [Metabacillus crassostreae]MBM7605051.1 ABC-2 type transport system ATP-binding protein [Metabacillus crassostreae]
MTIIVRTNELTKKYKGKEVVSNVNMTIKKGEIYGFLGPNGSGKTTMMKMLTNLVKPTHGEIEIFGEKLTQTSYEILKRIGGIIEFPVFYDRLTARENLELHCEYMGFYDHNAIDDAIDLVNLKHIDDKSVKDFSLGMKQRLGIARAIITKPELLILDEPINGLDPAGIRELRNLFKMLCKEYGITLLVSSHILGEIEQIADTIGVISDGKLVKEVSMSEIRELNTGYIELNVTDVKKAIYIIENNLRLVNYKVIGENGIRIYDQSASLSEVSKTLIINDVTIEEIYNKNDSLEDYFLSIVNGGGISA